MQMNFKLFIENNNQKDVEKTMAKLPKAHKKLISDYKLNFHPNNTLDGDSKNVGVINTKNKKITVASPWNYGREFTFLHEVAHLVWEHLLSEKDKKVWSEKVKKNEKRNKKESDEELFCMAYANHYANNKIVIHTNDDWSDFIKSI